MIDLKFSFLNLKLFNFKRKDFNLLLKQSKNNLMKMKKAFLTALAFLFTLSTVTFAQDNAPKSDWNFGIHSIGVGVGAYNPFMTFYNDGYYTKDWTNKFKTAPIYAANLELNVYKNVRIRLEYSSWAQTAKNTAVSAFIGGGTQQLDVKLTPITGTILYNILPDDKIQAYIGIGGGTVLVDSKYTRVSADEKISPSGTTDNTGRGAILSLIQGLDIPIVGGLRLGVEARFIFGDYTQALNGGIPAKSISLQGLQGLASLNYAFGK